MTPRERYIATLTHRTPDKVPFDPGYGRESTLRNWRRQGLPDTVTDYHAYLRQVIGIPADPAPQPAFTTPGVVTTMIPEFEEKILAERPASRIVQDWKGNVCEIGKEFTPAFLRGAPDFVTRSWLKCPVETHADWEDMRRRYHPDQPQRFPADFADRCRRLRDRNYVSGLAWSGPFWQLREWCGFENLCLLILDDPGFVRDMAEFWENFIAALLERTLAHYVPDYALINEDMAYKAHPMIGPDQCRQFLAPAWKRWGKILQHAGVPIYEVDSDGHVGELIPIWIECGLACNSPQEVAAGNDLLAYQRQYGRQMAYRGGVDKRAIARGGTAIRAEMDRLRPAIGAGGFVPTCDHGVPADVSWPNFVEYARVLAEATGWL